MFRRTLTLAALAAALLTAGPAAVAHADAFDDVFADFQRDGRIDPCRHSVRDLREARDGVPSDIEQYAPDFPAAVEEALEERARRDCGGSAGGGDAGGRGGGGATGGGDAAAGGATADAATGGGAAAAPAPQPGVVPQPPGASQASVAASDGAIVNAAAREPRRGGGDAPAPLVVLAVLGGLLLLALALWALVRALAWDPPWLARTRHAVAEAGWRLGGAWEDFADWVRRGRATPSG